MSTVQSRFQWAGFLAVLGLAALMAAPAVSGGRAKKKDVKEEGKKGDAIVVAIKEFKFDPDPVKVNVGDTVEWQNQDTATHTATGKEVDGKFLFDTSKIKPGKSAMVLFDQAIFDKAGGKPGGTVTIDYFCRIHPSMKGKVHLTAVAGGGDKKDEDKKDEDKKEKE